MGRGAHAAHAAYNASGTQGISVTNKINKDEEIHSVFLTQNDTSKQILHGHNISEMTCSGKTEGITSERYKIFTPDENSDMLGDIYLNFEMDSEITEFAFVDESNNNNPVNMYSFTEQSRTLDLKLAGSELKSLDIDLNTNQIPSVIDHHQKLDDLSFEVINQTRFIEINETSYQFIVGKAKNPSGYNLAWRDTTTDVWTKLNINKFQEINCLILETHHAGKGTIPGIIIFGGTPSLSNDQALLYVYLDDFVGSSPTTIHSFSDFPVKSQGVPYYKVVYTLNYYGERPKKSTDFGKIIVSGSKDHTNEYFRRDYNNSSTVDADKQTCVIVKIRPGDTNFTYEKVPFTHDIPFEPYPFDPIVSSSFSNTSGEHFITLGDKLETVLGIDSNGKLIRSYDNGKTWSLAPFYHGDTNTVATSGFYNHSDDQNFNYYIPELDYVISNNVGLWLAIGKQGTQSNTYPDGTTPREEVDYFRQFVFYSDNEGFEWYPLLFLTNDYNDYIADASVNTGIIHKEIVEYFKPHSLRNFGIMEVAFKVKKNTENSLGHTLQHPLLISFGILQTLPSPPAIIIGKATAAWPFAPTTHSTPGPFLFPEVTGTFYYEYIGVVNNRTRPIYYGFNSTTKSGVITCRPQNTSVTDETTRTSLFNGIYPRNIKYAYRNLLIGVFSNKNGDPGGNTTHEYRFKKSIDGITWYDIKINNSNTIESKKDPLIEGDKYGNFIVAISSGNNYNLYRYNTDVSNLEIIFDNTFNITNIFGINFVLNEWQIAIEIGLTEYLLKSYDLTKWFKTDHNVEGGSKVRQISYKSERFHDIIYRTDNFNSPYNSTDVIAYNILYDPSDGGAGVRAFKAEALATYQGMYGGGGITFYNVYGDGSTSENKEPNDIIHVNGKIFIASNKNGTIMSNYFDFPLVESNGLTSTSYQESETIYGNTSLGRVPVTSFADNLSRLYSSPRNPEIIFTVGYFSDTNDIQTYGVILYRTTTSSDVYDYNINGRYYWRVLMGPPLTSYDPSYYENNKGWLVSDFENITDVAMSKTRPEMVVVGKAKSGYNLVIFQNASTYDFREYTTQKLNFEIIYTVCNLGDLWVVGGKPSQSDEWNDKVSGAVCNNKCVAYTFDLENWKYIDFTRNTSVPNVTMPDSPFFTVANQGTTTSLTDSNNFEANDIKPLDVYGQTGILLQISFDHTILTTLSVSEKIYFMYVSGENLIIEQNNTYPEPSISFRDTDPSQNRKQLVPSFTTIIDNVERRLVATDYPNQFNLFYVVYLNGKFNLTSYSSNNVVPTISLNNTKPTQRFRKFINVDENSIIKRSNGHCYKIEKVKNENFVTGVNSARYVAVGKGNFSSIIWSDDLLIWNDADTSGIFAITFDITHKHGIWVAIGAGNYQVAISKDGKKWTGVDTKYDDNLPEIITEDIPFTSLAEFDPKRDNIADVLPYIPNLKGIFLRNLSILRLFNRIEYQVGTQIWQTLTFDDIKAMLDTEFGAGEYKNLLKNCSIINKNGSTRLTTWIPGFTKTLNSKLETFSNISENGAFPSGLLKDQKLSIKIYYNKLENVIGGDLESKDMNNTVFDNFMNNTLIPCDRDPNYYIDSFLADNYGFQLGDIYKNVNGHFRLKYKTEIQKFRLFSKRFELDDIEIDEFNKGIKQVPKMTQSLYFDADNVGYLLLDLDSFNIYASHIIVSGWLTSGVYITDMNLELNGHTYQKVIEPSVIDYATKSYLGLNYNRYTFNGVDKEDGTGSLIIPLASTAYSGSSVPLDRYTSIRLRINFNTLAGPRSYINVTCVGTTTVSYNNSTANIDIY